MTPAEVVKRTNTAPQGSMGGSESAIQTTTSVLETNWASRRRRTRIRNGGSESAIQTTAPVLERPCPLIATSAGDGRVPVLHLGRPSRATVLEMALLTKHGTMSIFFAQYGQGRPRIVYVVRGAFPQCIYCFRNAMTVPIAARRKQPSQHWC